MGVQLGCRVVVDRRWSLVVGQLAVGDLRKKGARLAIGLLVAIEIPRRWCSSE
jgi:hypothetical protein